MTELLDHSFCQTLKLLRINYQSSAELCFTIATLTQLQKHMLEVLHSEELDYWSSLAFAKRQQSYLLGRYAAKQAISRQDGNMPYPSILIKPGIFDYPIAYYPSTNHKVQITISHCENLGVALAFSEDHPMGIDLEAIKTGNKTTIAGQLTDHEQKLINSCTDPASELNPDILYTIFWTVKEALSKVLRTGMMTPFTIYAIKNIVAQDNYWISEFENFAQYQAMSFILGQQICSIVYPKQTELTINLSGIQQWISKRYSP